jgi:AraC-like DNA-binding protein
MQNRWRARSTPARFTIDMAAQAASRTTAGAAALAQAWQRSAFRRQLFDTTDRDCARDMVGRVFRPHRLEPGGGSRLHASMEHVGAGLLGMSELHYGATVDILPGPLESFYLLQIPVAGAAHIETAGRAFVSDTANASLISPAPDLRMRWLAGNTQLCVRIEAEVLRRFIAAWSGKPCSRLPVFEPQVALDAHPMLLDVLLSLIEAAEAPKGDCAMLPSAQLQHRVLAVLLGGLPHDARAQLEGSCPPVTPRCVRMVEEYLVAHADQPLTPETLSLLAGVSVRSLYLGFQRYRGVSPMRLLHEVRLRRAHEDLLQASPGTRVTDVALRWGLGHLGRFSQDYREAFGESPSETLRATLGR